MSDNVLEFPSVTTEKEAVIERVIEKIRDGNYTEFVSIFYDSEGDISIIRSPFESRTKLIGTLEWLKSSLVVEGQTPHESTKI